MLQLNEIELPRSPTVLPPKTLPLLSVRTMPSSPEREPETDSPSEPRFLISAFIAIAFRVSLVLDQLSFVTEPKFTRLPMTPIRAEKIASRFIFLPYFRGGCSTERDGAS